MRIHLSVITLWSLLTTYYVSNSTANPIKTRQVTSTTLTNVTSKLAVKSGHPTNVTSVTNKPFLAASTRIPKFRTRTTTTHDPSETSFESQPVISEKEQEIIYLIATYGFQRAFNILEKQLFNHLRGQLTEEDERKLREALLKAIFDFHLLDHPKSTTIGYLLQPELKTSLSKPTTTTTTPTPLIVKQNKDGGASDTESLDKEAKVDEDLKKRSLFVKGNSKISNGFPLDRSAPANHHDHMLATSITRKSTGQTSQVTSQIVAQSHHHVEPPPPQDIILKLKIPYEFAKNSATGPVQIQATMEQGQQQTSGEYELNVSTTEKEVVLKEESKKSCPTFASFVTEAKDLWNNLLKGNGFVSSLSLVIDAWVSSMKSLGFCFLGMGSQIWNYFYKLFKPS